MLFCENMDLVRQKYLTELYNCLGNYNYLQECINSYKGNTNFSAKLLNLFLDSTIELECDLTCNEVESVSRRMLFALHTILLENKL